VRRARRSDFQTRLEALPALDGFEPTEGNIDELARSMDWTDTARLKEFLRKATGQRVERGESNEPNAAA
jgi:hypothetical protein